MWPFKRKSVIVRNIENFSQRGIPDTEAAIRFAQRETGMNCFGESFKITSLPRNAAHGTALAGHVRTTYKELKAIFGKASHGDYKTRKEWCVSIGGVVCTIYDWKTGRRPLKRITQWNVGGSSALSYHLVRMAIMEYRLLQYGSQVRGHGERHCP
jgi:hypothetical protein